MKRRWLAALGTLGVVMIVILLYALNIAPFTGSGEGEAPPLGDILADQLDRGRSGVVPADAGFTDLAGAPLRLADFRGRVLVVNFWATWCAPCLREMPDLDRLAAALGDDPRFAVLAVSQDRDGRAVVAPFLAVNGLANLIAFLDAGGRMGRALGVRGLPTTLLIDADGREIGRVEGIARWDAPEMVAFLRYHMEKAAPRS